MAATTTATAQVQLGSTSRLSENLAGIGGQGTSRVAQIALNGQRIVFQSSAANLASGDTNSVKDIFTRNLQTNVIEILSVTGDGSTQANADSDNPRISPIGPDGFYVVVFDSDATNLGSFTDANGSKDVFVRIPSLNLTEFISYASGPAASNGASSNPDVTIARHPDRAVVVYQTDASNIVSGDTNGVTDIVLASLTAPDSDNSFDPSTDLTNTLISHTPGGSNANGASTNPRISGDANYVVFLSQATNLVSGVTIPGGTTQLYLYDVANDSISLISKSASNSPGNANSGVAAISYTGRYIVYATNSTNILSDGSAGFVLYDRTTGTSTRIDTDTTSGPSNSTSSLANSVASISADGRFVVFSTNATDLTSDSDTNGTEDIFIKDLDSGTISKVNFNLNGGQTTEQSLAAGIAGQSFTSTTGQIVYFSKDDTIVNEGSVADRDDIFQTTGTLPKPTFNGSNTELQTPPGVNIASNQKKITISLQEFDDDTNAATGTLAATKKVKYIVKLKRKISDTKEKVIKKKSTKKTTLTLKTKKNGQYSVEYTAKRGGKTPISPKERFTINR